MTPIKIDVHTCIRHACRVSSTTLCAISNYTNLSLVLQEHPIILFPCPTLEIVSIHVHVPLADADLLPYFCFLFDLSNCSSRFSSEREAGHSDEVNWLVKAGLVFQQLSAVLRDENWVEEGGWDGRGVRVMRRPRLAKELFAFNLKIQCKWDTQCHSNGIRCTFTWVDSVIHVQKLINRQQRKLPCWNYRDSFYLSLEADLAALSIGGNSLRLLRFGAPAPVLSLPLPLLEESYM